MTPLDTAEDVASLLTDRLTAWLIGLVCFCIIAVDGFDTATIAFVAPTLSKLWNLPHAALTPAFVMTSIGAVVGYMLSGTLAGRFGRRRVISTGMIAFGALSIATAFAGNVATISGTRLFTAISLGCVLPAAISYAADHAPATARAAVTICVTTGLSVGTAFGGVLASQLLTRFGWASVFLAGGVLPIMLLPFALAVLRDEADCEESSIRTRHRKTAPLHGIGVPSTGQQTARLSNLWRAPFATTTLLIWAIAFFVFLVTYQFIFWIPTLLVSYGFSPASAALGSSACAIGGILANVALLPLVGRFGMHRLLIATACLAIACIGALSLGVVDRALVLWLIGGIGAGITSGCVGQSTLAILAYPERLRTAGVGFAAAAGRVGAIVGPGLGGALLSMNIPAQRIITLCCIPIVLVVVFLESARRSTPRG